MHVAWGWGGAGGAAPFIFSQETFLFKKKMNYHGVAIAPPFGSISSSPFADGLGFSIFPNLPPLFYFACLSRIFR